MRSRIVVTDQQFKTLPEHLKTVVKGNRTNGRYLPDNQFYRDLIKNKIRPHTDKTVIDGLYLCQQQCLYRMLTSNRLLVNLSPGLGKTYVTAHYLKLSRATNVFIIAPKSLHYVWQQHLNDYTDLNSVIRPTYHDSSKVTITNIQQVDRTLQHSHSDEPSVVIIDESIIIKNRESKAFLTCKKWFGDTEYLFLLSGSPYSRSISDLWSQLNLLYPHEFTSYWDFAKIFCRVIVDRYGWKIEDNRSDIEPVLKASLQQFIYSAHIDDVVDLPEQTEVIIDIDPTPKQLDIYKEWKKKGTSHGVDIDGPLSLLTRYKQLSLSPKHILDIDIPSPKLDTLSDILSYCEYPCIVVSSSNVVLEKLHSTYDSTLFNASEPDGHKQYTSGVKDLMFMQVASGKFGHSFTNTKTLIYLDYTFISDDLYQSLARVKRVTTKHPVTIYHLHCMQIDKAMFKLSKERNLSVETLLKELE